MKAEIEATLKNLLCMFKTTGKRIQITIPMSHYGEMEKSRRSLRRGVLWHLLVALAVPFVGLSLNYALKIHAPLLVGVLLFWAWSGYLYWVIDRIVQVWLVPSVIRGGLRTIVASLFFWCPVALGWAVLQFIDWRRAYSQRSFWSIAPAFTGEINPATGLHMMTTGLDISGNPYGAGRSRLFDN